MAGVLTEQLIKARTRMERLDDVRNLNMWGQELSDISIIQHMPNVEVLSLSVNSISSLKDFRFCSKLQELYLRKNSVANVREIQYLVPLKELRVLWLSENPCADHPSYRAFVIKQLPRLQKLDNVEISDKERQCAGNDRSLDALSSQLENMSVESSRVAVHDPPRLSPEPRAAPSARAVTDGLSPRPSGSHDSPNGGNTPLIRKPKNVLYAVMALLGELEHDDLVLVKREVEQRLSGSN